MSGMIGQSYCPNNPGFPLGFMPYLQFLTIQVRGSLQRRRRHGEEKTSWTSIQAAQTMYLYHCIDFKVNVQSFSPVVHSYSAVTQCVWKHTAQMMHMKQHRHLPTFYFAIFLLNGNTSENFVETVLKVTGTFPILYKSLKVSLKKLLVCHIHRGDMISS